MPPICGTGDLMTECIRYGIYIGTGSVWRRDTCLFVCTSLTVDGPQRARLPISPTANLPSCLWSRTIFPSHPGSHLMNFYHDASSALLQFVNQWSYFTFPRSHAFRYGSQNKNSAFLRIELMTSALLVGVRGYLLDQGLVDIFHSDFLCSTYLFGPGDGLCTYYARLEHRAWWKPHLYLSPSPCHA